jgi:Ca2+-transporting ATPase
VVSLLFALTLAMSAVPEEIPVAFSSFMALGTYKMSKLGIISRKPQIIENLGAVSVICFDKTGTITENKMEVKTIYDYKSDAQVDLPGQLETGKNVLLYGVLASERNPFDTMEKAIWEAAGEHIGDWHLQLKMIHEYPLGGQPPMMTHLYKQEDSMLVAGKGAAERIIQVCRLQQGEREKIKSQVVSLASKGYRVIGVASAVHGTAPLPMSQDDFNWQFEGLLALYDPPKKNIRQVIEQFYSAGIDVKLVTGDYTETAMQIAKQVGILNHLKCVNGEQVMQMNREELNAIVKTTSLFARMFPDAKLKLIEAIKDQGEIVAMTGDGVNDGPALKSAHIGIAMGKRGTEIARQAADLVITDDNLQRMVIAVSEGRKIFNNLKKAVRYIISIHIPIILIASLPLIFGWAYPNVFTPIHVIFMELIMGPTCSIFFEKEPVEEDLMKLSPRPRDAGLFNREELLLSIVQGIVITAGCLALYYIFMNDGATLEKVRTIVFTSLLISNVFLTFVNRSVTQTIKYTIHYKNKLAPFIIVISVAFLAAILALPFLRNLFQLTTISAGELALCTGVALAGVMWFEVYKAMFRPKSEAAIG